MPYPDIVPQLVVFVIGEFQCCGSSVSLANAEAGAAGGYLTRIASKRSGYSSSFCFRYSSSSPISICLDAEEGGTRGCLFEWGNGVWLNGVASLLLRMVLFVFLIFFAVFLSFSLPSLSFDLATATLTQSHLLDSRCLTIHLMVLTFDLTITPPGAKCPRCPRLWDGC
jgi:hypothetical protein